MPSLALFLKGTGALLMLHAAYSCMHYRSILMDLDLLDAAGAGAASSDMMIPPLDVYVQVGISFFLVLVGELWAMGPLQTVEVLQESSSNNNSRKPLAAPPHKTRDFDIYSNRSKLLFKRAVAAR